MTHTDPAVERIEGFLRSRAPEATLTRARGDERISARHAVLICACISDGEAPNWVVHDAPGHVAWGRIADGLQLDDVMRAERRAVGHADPISVLAWLQGDIPDPWDGGDGWGDDSVVDVLRPGLGGTS